MAGFLGRGLKELARATPREVAETSDFSDISHAGVVAAGDMLAMVVFGCQPAFHP